MYKEHDINKTKNFISGWYISKTLCQEIVEKTLGKNKLKFIGQENTGNRGYVQSSLEVICPELYKIYVTELNNLFNLYLDEYEFVKKRTFLPFAEIQKSKNEKKIVLVQYYKKNNYYQDLHAETIGLEYNQRTLVFMTYLNSMYDGGGTEWPYQNFISKPEQGLTFLWPAGWTHLHRGVNSISEEKYIVTGWYVNTK